MNKSTHFKGLIMDQEKNLYLLNTAQLLIKNIIFKLLK